MSSSFPLVRCKSCNARIVMLKTRKGRWCPTNLPVENTAATFDSSLHKAHFATCPNAKKHRKSEKDRQPPLQEEPHG